MLGGEPKGAVLGAENKEENQRQPGCLHSDRKMDLTIITQLINHTCDKSFKEVQMAKEGT